MRKQDFPWVDVTESFQWRSFLKLIDILKRRGNRVFVLIGPFNPYILTRGSLRRYDEVKKEMEKQLRKRDMDFLSFSNLPSEYYADASHPLGEGYAELARWLYRDEAFGRFIAHRPDDAEWVITQAQELAGHLPAAFYLDLANCCFRRRQAEIGNDYVRRAEQIAEGNPDDLVDVGIFYLDRKNESQAVVYFERALRLDPEHGLANLHVGASYAAALEMRQARRYWRQARRTARRTGDEELLRAVELARQTFDRAIEMIEQGLPPFGMYDDYDDEYY